MTCRVVITCADDNVEVVGEGDFTVLAMFLIMDAFKKFGRDIVKEMLDTG